MGFSDLKIDDGKFMKVDAGDTQTIRILSKEPFKKLVHRGQTKTVPCTGDTACLPCKEGNPSKVRWACNVYNRKLAKVQIFEFGSMVGKQLKNIAKMLEDEGNTIHQVDLRISADGEGLKKTYTVLPKDNTEDVPEGLALYELK